MYNKILVPVDLADLEVAQPALEKAVALAKTSNAELRLLNVMSMIPAAYLDYMPSNYDSQERQRSEADIKKLAESEKDENLRRSFQAIFENAEAKAKKVNP